MTSNKKALIAIDLDGIFVGKPPIISADLVNYLYRKTKEEKLVYKLPNSRFQKTIRQLSHSKHLRPVIENNVEWLKQKLKSEKFQIVILSGRYSFLEEITKKLLNRNSLPIDKDFLKVNLNDQQPHLFKEQMIRKMKVKYMIDDDIYMLEYLALKIPETVFIWYAGSPYFRNHKFSNTGKLLNLVKINKLEELDKIIDR